MSITEAITVIPGSITAPAGFRAAGVASGLKKSGLDLMLLVADHACSVAGVFTTNVVKAAPVLYTRTRVRTGRAQAVVINTAVANACTGEEGMRNSEQMALETAQALGIPTDLVLVCSTGVIGRQLPMETISSGIRMAVQELTDEPGQAPALAIMTTDTRPKEATVRVETSAGPITISGIAKGSGMIAPNMATMLSVITTDAQIDADVLQTALSNVVKGTFNRVTVDGDTSTNDTVLLLASGKSCVRVDLGMQDFALFERGLFMVAEQLARLIARDGEGATKLIEVYVYGTGTDAEADAIARTIANSPLVKTALFGNDPNWGRILAAAGRAGICFSPNKVDLDLAGIPVVRAGQPLPVDRVVASNALKKDEVSIHLILGEGEASARFWTCDFSYDYVKINADYTT